MKRHDIIGSKLTIRDADSIAYWRDSGDLCLISRSHRNGVSASMAPDQVAGSNGAAMSRASMGSRLLSTLAGASMGAHEPARP